MSAFIGSLHGPGANGASVVADVWASSAGVEVRPGDENLFKRVFTAGALDPIVARNFAALLVRAGDEVERMRHKPAQGG